MTFSTHFRNGLIVSAAVLALDQVTKWWIVFTIMRPPRIIEITPFFNLVMGWNYGISFGFLNSVPALGLWLLPMVAVVITAALGVWLYRTDRLRPALALGLIIGGALGNLVDRLRFGAVADFLDFHAWGYHWPAFNAADSAITVGAVVLILDSLFVRDEKP
jgi:signal peptidase II